MHALCRFFLEQSGPSHVAGDREMLPFLVDMARLFELFVAEWLKSNLPREVQLKAQERVSIDEETDLHFDIDLVLYDAESGQAQCVMDTKYKVTPTPATADISQVVAYAEAKGCTEAVLVYPQPLTGSLDKRIGSIRVRSCTFSLGGDIELNGRRFVGELLHSQPGPCPSP